MLFQVFLSSMVLAQVGERRPGQLAHWPCSTPAEPPVSCRVSPAGNHAEGMAAGAGRD